MLKNYVCKHQPNLNREAAHFSKGNDGVHWEEKCTRHLLKILLCSSKSVLMQQLSKARLFSAEVGLYGGISFAGIHSSSLNE